jgi:hypothetical protein
MTRPNLHRVCRQLACFAVALALLLLLESAAQACPGCKNAIGNQDKGHADLVSGYFWSILFMMSMPFTLLGTFSGYLYLQVRRARRQTANDPAANLFAGESNLTGLATASR